MPTISIVIVTFNRPNDVLALLHDINRMKGNDLLLEVILLNNQSTESYQTVVDSIGGFQYKVDYFTTAKNLGVAGGRNAAASRANGDVLIFLDDDILIPDTEFLIKVVQSFNVRTDEGRPVAVINYKVLYAENNQVQRTAFPHKDFDRYIHQPRFFTYYFVGCAHAFRRDVWNEMGGYPEDFFYGMEEYDLSYRLLANGYSIAYDASVVVLHKESAAGRTPKPIQLSMMWFNKSRVAWRYLPKRYFWSTAMLWWFEFMRKVGVNPKLSGLTWRRILNVPAKERRTPLSKTTLAYLRSKSARLSH
jgi:GT2 family glycosyltransferase